MNQQSREENLDFEKNQSSMPLPPLRKILTDIRFDANAVSVSRLIICKRKKNIEKTVTDEYTCM